jgi:RHS repeat-associated protein
VWRGVLAVTATIGLTLVGTVTPAEASPAEQARRIASATLAEVRAAAAVQDARVAAETQAPDPAATGTITPDTQSEVAADALGASASFSGNKVDTALTVTVGVAPKAALRAARSEAPNNGTVVSDPVEITAKDSDGKQVTQFPAKTVNTRGGGDKGPVVSDVIPGVRLELKPDAALVKSSKADPSTLQIYTRETPGDPWTALPSYYDKKADVVRGESTHLSQFVVIGTPFPLPARPVIVLDPDNDEGHVSSPAPPVTELPYNMALAQGVQSRLQTDCLASVYLTRDASNSMVSRDVRAGIAASHNPTVTLGIGFNTNRGTAWGSPTTGGSQVYSRGAAADNAVSDSLVGVLPTYTGRPAKNKGNNGNFPGDEFAGLPGAFTHLEALFMDHNFDRPVIDNGMNSIADGVLTGLGIYLQSQGFNCTDPVTGGWPTPPSAAELARWRDLGHQNYLTYGGDPVSFSTGNLVEDEKLFTLPGKGGSATDITLTYNSQDGRLSRVGAGWSFGLGARAQRFIDNSVLIERGDGASYVFNSDGHGGYTAEPGLHQTLTEAGSGTLRLTAVSGESWVFDAGDIDGIGELTAHTDTSGNTTTLTYGPANPDVNQFTPLTAIIDASGQTIQVSSDAQGRVTGFTRPGGDHWALAYDSAGNLTTITLPDGRTHTFSYDDKHQLVTATDATGALYLKNQYDDSGRAVKQWDADQNLRVFDYTTAGQTTYTDNEGRKSVFAFDYQHRITNVTHPDGTTVSYTFDDRNNVTSTTDENGHTTTYRYDGDGNLIQQTDPTGAATKYTYTPTGNVATVTDTGGTSGAARTTTYDYNTAGNVTATRQPDGTTVTNTYDAAGELVATAEPSGVTTAYGYDGHGNLTSMTDPVGAKTTYAYDAAGRMTAQTDPNGNTTTYAWDSGDRMATATDAARHATTYGFDGNNHVTQTVDGTGAVTKYSWDAMFHLTSSTDATGAITKYTYTAEDVLLKAVNPLGATTSNTLDRQDRATETTDPNGGVWKHTYDPVGNELTTTSPAGATTLTEYDKADRVVATTDGTGATTTYKYDTVGRMVKQVDPDGVAQKFTYDLMDRVTRVTDGLGKHIDYGYDVDGNLVTVTDRNRRVTQYAYDAAGHVTSSTTPMGETSTYGYDSVGNLTTATDPLGRTVTTTYTSTNQVATVVDPAGNTTTYGYDGNGRPTTMSDPLGHTTTNAFDPDGRMVSTTDPTGATTTYGYDAAGNQTTLVDGMGHTTAYSYDPAGQLTAVTEGVKAGANPSSDVNVTTKYGYDPDGNLTEVTDPNGHTTSYTFDKVGRTTTETNPVGGKSRYGYTKAGRSAVVTNGNGQTTRSSYNSRGDITTVDQAGQTASYEYDPNRNLIAMTDPTGVSGWTYDKDGRVTTQIDQTGGHLTSSYDKASQVTSMQLPTGQTLTYTYDHAGHVTSQKSPWGSLTYGWDAASNLSSLSRSTGVNTTYSYDANNRVTGILHQTPAPKTDAPATPTPKPAPVVSKKANGCTTVAAYLGARTQPGAGNNKLCKTTNSYLNGRTLPTPADPVADGGSLEYGYQYNAEGNVTKATRTITAPIPASATTPTPPVTSMPTPSPSTWSGTTASPDSNTPVAPKRKVQSVAYTYDSLDRLATSKTKTGKTNTYGYDPAGNRTSWTSTGTIGGNFSQTAIFSAANRITQTTQTGTDTGTTTYGYDGAGNRTNQTINGATTDYGYDTTGRTTAVNRNGRNTSYAYDGLGRQATNTDTTEYGTIVTHTVYNGTTPIQQTDQLHGTTTQVRDAAGGLAEHVTQTGAATWDLLDGLGSSVAETQGSSITQLLKYSEWGIQDFESSGWSAPTGYTGQESDPTQGLNHYYARSYDPTTGSWTTPDVWVGLITQPRTLSRYAYVEDNPTTFTDYLGYLVSRLHDSGGSAPSIANFFAQPGYSLDTCSGSNPRPPCANAHDWGPPPTPPYVHKKNSPAKSKGPSSENAETLRHLLYEAYWPTGINCDTQMKVGFSNRQLAINEACGEALSRASMSTQAKWQQDLYYGPKQVSDGIKPWVLLGVVGSVGEVGLPAQVTGARERAPSVIATQGLRLPGVPTGGIVVATKSEKGLEYLIPARTAELDSRVVSIRIMDATTNGKYPYPDGYAVYMNAKGQSVNPLTGQVVSKTDPWAHIPLK